MSFNGGGASPNDAILFGFRRTMRAKRRSYALIDQGGSAPSDGDLVRRMPNDAI